MFQIPPYLELYFISGSSFSCLCYCLLHADDTGVTLPLWCFSCSVGFVAVPGRGSGLSNSTLSKMELKAEFTVDWIVWVRHMQRFCRFCGKIQAFAFLVLINMSGFVPEQCSTCNNSNCSSRWQKVYVLQALDKGSSAWQGAAQRQSGRLNLLKNMCSALSFHPNLSLTRYQNELLVGLEPSAQMSAPWLCCWALRFSLMRMWKVVNFFVKSCKLL